MIKMKELKTSCSACHKQMVLNTDSQCFPIEIEGHICGVICDNCAERYNNGEIEMFIKIEFAETSQESNFDYTDLSS